MRIMCLCGFALTMLAGCSIPSSFIDPGFVLTAVERPADTAERWGDFMLAPADSSGFTYEDDLLALAIVPVAGLFDMVLENRTDFSIRFLWPDAAYVGPTGLSSRIVPGETRWIEMNNPATPQLIPSRSSASMTLIPRANANTSTQTIERFLPPNMSCEDASSASVRLVLPVEIQGVTNEYTLLFAAGDQPNE